MPATRSPGMSSYCSLSPERDCLERSITGRGGKEGGVAGSGKLIGKVLPQYRHTIDGRVGCNRYFLKDVSISDKRVIRTVVFWRTSLRANSAWKDLRTAS